MIVHLLIRGVRYRISAENSTWINADTDAGFGSVGLLVYGSIDL